MDAYLHGWGLTDPARYLPSDDTFQASYVWVSANFVLGEGVALAVAEKNISLLGRVGICEIFFGSVDEMVLKELDADEETSMSPAEYAAQNCEFQASHLLMAAGLIHSFYGVPPNTIMPKNGRKYDPRFPQDSPRV